MYFTFDFLYFHPKDDEADVEEPNSRLEKEIVDLKNENECLKNQLRSSAELEAKNAELRKENEELKRENQRLLSSACLVARLERIVLDEHENTTSKQTK